MATNAIAIFPADGAQPKPSPLFPNMSENKIVNQLKEQEHKNGKHEKTQLMSTASTSQGLFTQEGLPEVSC